MPNNFAVPDEQHIEKLVKSVYENLPVAEIVRLNRIEEQLVRKQLLKKPDRKVNILPWWIVLLIAGGFATAAWWAGERYLISTVHNDTEATNINYETIKHTDTLQKTEIQQKPAREIRHGETGQKKSTIIYKRSN